MAKYRAYTNDLSSEAVSEVMSMSGARLVELPDGLPHLRIEPRVGNGLQIENENINAFGHTGVQASRISLKLATGGGLSFNGNGELLTSGVGTGDVSGPAFSTANAIARFDGPSGDIIKNSVVTIDDTGSIEGVTQVDFDTADTAAAAGRLRWDSTDGTLKLILAGGTTDIRLGQEEVQRVLNVTGATLLKGKAVRVVGAQGNRKTVALAQSDIEGTSSTTFGVLVENVANNAQGYVMISGYVRDIDTSAFAEGAILWLSSATAGSITTTRPAAPNHGVQIGFCVKQHASAGIIYVNVQNGYEIDELHNVTITTPAAGDMLRYTGSIWTNVASPNLASGASYQINGTSVLSASTLGTGVTASSLTSLGTLTSLSVSGSISHTGSTANLSQSSTTALATVGSGTGSGGTGLSVRSAAGQLAEFSFTTGSSLRWNLLKGNEAESGSNAGSPLKLAAYTDAGAFIDTVLTITRAANGSIAFASGRPITGGTYNGQSISSTASLTGTLSVAGLATFSGTGVIAGNATQLGSGRLKLGVGSGSVWPVIQRDSTTGGLAIITSDGTTETTRMLVGPTSVDIGNVTGLTQPSNGLRVQGDIRAGGTIYASDFVLTGGAGSGTGLVLDALDDVITTGAYPPSDQYVLTYDVAAGNKWIPKAASGGGGGGTTVTIADDTSTNGNRYLSFVASTSGTASTLNVSSTKLTFNPSTGVLTTSGGVNSPTVTRSTVAQDSTGTLITSTTAANQVVMTLSATTYRSAKFHVQATSGSAYQVTEILVVHDGTTCYLTEYGTITTGASLATFNVDISGGNIRLLVTPTNAVTTIKADTTAITV